MKRILLFVLALVAFSISCNSNPPALKKPAVFAATVGPAPGPPPFPICNTTGSGTAAGCPASWFQAAWFVDPANTSTCASDSNATCGQSTCTAGVPGTADGPCLSYTQIASRWGTYSPRLQQVTTVTFMSSQSTEGDPIYWTPSLEQSAQAIIACTLPTPSQTGTLGVGTAAKNRATPALQQAQFASAAVVGQWVNNTTKGSSAWVNLLNSGTTYFMSQPLTTALPPGTFVSEDNLWASGNAYSIYTLNNINLANFQPVVEGNNAATPAPGAVEHCNIISPLNHNDNLIINDTVQMLEMGATTRTVRLTASPIDYDTGATNFTNVNIAALFSYYSTSSALGVSVPIIGGRIGLLFGSASPTCDTLVLTGAGLNQAQIGPVYLTSGLTIGITGNNFFGDASGDGCAGAGFWGPGSVNIQGISRVSYAAGAGQAVLAFENTGTLRINTLATSCLLNPAAGTTTFTCNETVSAASLDTVLGASIANGCFFSGGGSICNTGAGGK